MPNLLRLLGSCGAAAAVIIADYVVVLSGCVIAGRELGEYALGAMNLVLPVMSLVTFVSWLVASGTCNAYQKAIGRSNRPQAERIAGTGLIASFAAGLAMLAVLAALEIPYVDFMDPSDATTAFSSAYWKWYPLVVLLQSVGLTLFYLVYAGGGAVTCVYSYLVQVAAGVVAPYWLCERWGMSGISLGAAVAYAAGILSLLPRFFLGRRQLRVRPAFDVVQLVHSLRSSLPEASMWLFHALVFFAVVKVVIGWWDSESLAVLAIVFCIVRFTTCFGGIGAAFGNVRGADERGRFFAIASAVSFSLMAFTAAIFMIAPEPFISVFGIENLELAAGAKFAARVTVVTLLLFAGVAYALMRWRFRRLAVPEAQLNYLQSYVLSRMRESPDTQMFNLARLFRVRRGVDLERLSQALVGSARTHAALLSTLAKAADGEIVQRQRFGAADVTCPVVKADEREILSAGEGLVRTFDPFGDRLFDAKIFDCGENAYLLSNFHHLVCDGFSFALILDGARKLYEGGALEADSYYPILARRRERADGETAAAMRTLLRGLLSDPKFVTLPRPDFHGAPGCGVLDVELKVPEGFAGFLATRRLTRHHAFLAATALALAKVTGADNVLIDWVFHGRVAKDELKTVGSFMVDLPLELENLADLTKADVFARVKQATFRGIKNVGCIREVTDVNPDGRDRLTFNYHDEWGDLSSSGPVAAESPFGWMVEETMTLSAPAAQEENPFNVGVVEHAGRLRLLIEYDAGSYSPASVRRFADTYQQEVLDLV